MRASLSTRIFVGFAIVVACFGAASFYAVAAVTTLRGELGFLRNRALPLLDQLRQSSVELRGFDEALRRAAPHDLDWLARFVREARPYQRASLIRERLAGLQAAVHTPRFAEIVTGAPPALPDLGVSLDDLARSTDARDRIARDPELLQALGGNFAAGDDALAFRSLVDGLERAVADRRLSDASRVVVEVRRLIRHVHSAMAEAERSFERTLDARFALAEQSESRLAMMVVSTSGVSLAVAIAVLLVMLASLSPMRVLAEVVRRFAAGDRKARADTRGAREVHALAVEWNRMADALAERESQLGSQREDIARSERLAALGHMAARMAHEIRNPLSSIGLNAELLDEELTGGVRNADEARELLQAISSEIERLRTITEGYLNRARPMAPERRRVDLVDLVGNLLDFARGEMERRGVHVQVDAHERCWCDADARLVRQALWNLVRNAGEAMPGGGQLWIAVVRQPDPEGTARDGVLIVVEDSGPGVDSAAAARIFEPFFTTKERGTGVGLALVREIFTVHGGRVGLGRPRHGGGACFELWLPEEERA